MNHQTTNTNPQQPLGYRASPGHSAAVCGYLLPSVITIFEKHKFRDHPHVRHLWGRGLWGAAGYCRPFATCHCWRKLSPHHPDVSPSSPSSSYLPLGTCPTAPSRPTQRSIDRRYKGRFPASCCLICVPVFPFPSLIVFVPTNHHSQWRAENNHSTSSS